MYGKSWRCCVPSGWAFCVPYFCGRRCREQQQQGREHVHNQQAASMRAVEQQAVCAMAAERHFWPPEIPEPTLMETVLRHGLFYGAVLQLVCVLAIMLPVSKFPEAMMTLVFLLQTTGRGLLLCLRENSEASLVHYQRRVVSLSLGWMPEVSHQSSSHDLCSYLVVEVQEGFSFSLPGDFFSMRSLGTHCILGAACSQHPVDFVSVHQRSPQ
ncbi:uncharacterized protein [Excalfactoria chinensis]|uniref:uncharacterized protein isoform X2 n=1 Tax=Excalfactoria chinensis TaxID=46218 RepID=UPI003B3AB761